VSKPNLTHALVRLGNVFLDARAYLPDVSQGEPRNGAILPVLRMLATWGVSRLQSGSTTKDTRIPVRGDRAEPLNAGVLHRHIGVEALGDGVADEGGALLLQQPDQPLLLRHQRVDLRRLAVEEVGDGELLRTAGHGQSEVRQGACGEREARDPACGDLRLGGQRP